MDFTSYTSRPVQLAVDLINTLQEINGTDDLTNLEDLQEFMTAHGEERAIEPEDVAEAQFLREELRKVFAATEETDAATILNQLLQHFEAIPRISWHGGPLHLHFEAVGTGFVRWLGAATAMGLAIVLCDYGKERLGICGSASCQKAFVDVSKNQCKQYCSDTCAHRESVAAFRARKRTTSKLDSSHLHVVK